jgi:hypothetical protein
MKLKEYLLKLEQLVEQEPFLLDCEVIFETDEHIAKLVDFPPIIGHKDGNVFHVMSPVPFIEKKQINAIRLV